MFPELSICVCSPVFLSMTQRRRQNASSVNGTKLKEARFRVDIRKRFFTMKVGKPREIVQAPILEAFKVRLDGVLSNLL